MNLNTPFGANEAAILTSLGFVREFFPASYRDIGTAERGPKVIGHPDTEIWTKDNFEIVVIDNQIVAAAPFDNPPWEE